MAVQIGPKIGIEGEKEYRNQLKAIINETKNLDAAMNKTASEWTANTSQMTKNSAIAKNLVQQIANEEKAINAMNQMLQEASERFGEASGAAQAWQRAIDNTTASLNIMKSQLSNLGGAENFSALSTKMADVGQKMQNIGSTLTSIGTKMTMALTVPLVAAGSAAINLASNMEEASSKVDVIFGNMSESVKAFADTSLESYGVSNVKAMELMGTFGAMATEMGISDAAAAEMAKTLTGLSGDLAAFHNTEVDIAANSLEGIFTGQTKALTQFTGAINQANLEEFAAKQGKVYSQMSEGEKVITRYQLVLERTKDAQGNFAATGEGTAGSIQKFKGAVQQLGVAFGQQLLPMITPIIQAITSFITMLSNLPEPVQKIIVVIGVLVAVIGPLIMIIGSLMSAMGSIITNAPIIAGAFSNMGTAISSALASLAAVAPELLVIVGVIALVVAAIILLVAKWDELTSGASATANAISAAWASMGKNTHATVDAFGEAVDEIVQHFAEMPNKTIKAIKQAIQGIKDAFSQMVNTAKKSGKDFINGFVDGITNGISKVVNACKKIADTVEQYLGFSCPDKGALSKYETWMPDFMNGLAKGINENKGVVIRAINGLTKQMALPLDASASMNMALAGSGANGSSYIGGTTMNVYVDHISELNDLIRIQNQAQQRYRMGAR